MEQEKLCMQPRYSPDEADMTVKPISTIVDKRFDTDLNQIIEKLNDLTLQDQNSSLGNSKLLKELNELNDRVIRLAKQVPVVEEDAYQSDEEEIRVLRQRVKALEQSRLLLPIFTTLTLLKNKITNETSVDNKTGLDKEIAIVSSDVTNGIKVEFPAMHKMYWGDNFSISPAKYVRASMSIPYFFTPFEITYDIAQKNTIEAEWRNLVSLNKTVGDLNPKVLMVDGGVLSNFPVNIFTNTDTPVPLKPTLGIKLEFEDDAESRSIDSFKTLTGAMVSTMRYFYDRDFISKHNIYNKTVRSIDTGNIHWLNFDLKDNDKIELFFRGALSAAIFLLGSLEDGDAIPSTIQAFRNLGKNVPFRKGKGEIMNIYGEGNEPNFKIEDLGQEDVRFNWKKLKIDRILILSEQDAIRTRLKKKAGFSQQGSGEN
jgi:predicted acylesterase/phospholipase RssA